ncbi:hypothetical protein KY290_017305 [Solanum tuberosum]|uniref:NB-ARC domain-containing protein n=1 Tax=Solanum tuberosum TaxID=4113 RepID=A0ABQ7VB01_SOLTU|nr:hypothetical protein KY284_016325 [Solanum tuberosum]KAH0761232.1 hypothetical protein KY290_017305 [Solanum tuberosum]
MVVLSTRLLIVLPQFQLMAERVGHFLWEDHTDEVSQLSELDEDDQTDENAQLSELDEDDQNDRASRLFKLSHLLMKIIPIELEEEIGQVEEDLESIRYFFMNIEQEWYNDLWARVLNVTYEAKDVIDSIIVRDNGLLHLIFSLPINIKKIKLIKKDISNLHEKIPENRCLNVLNSPKKPVESKSLTTDKIIVGFEEETNLILRKLTSGPADLDVISITDMPGSSKTTLAYKYTMINQFLAIFTFVHGAWLTKDMPRRSCWINFLIKLVTRIQN